MLQITANQESREMHNLGILCAKVSLHRTMICHILTYFLYEGSAIDFKKHGGSLYI